MTQKLRLILLIILILLLSALISKNAALVWMGFPFLFYVLTGLITIPKEISLSAHRIISHQRCKAGTLITMTLIVKNKGGDLPFIQVHESLSPQIHLIGKPDVKCGDLPSKEKMEIVYKFQAPRGKFNWEKIQVSVSDPFQLFAQIIDLPAESEVTILPDEMFEKPFKLNPKHTLRSPGLYQSSRPGSGINFLGVREYFPGDPLRSIQWRLSARYPKQLFCKEFEREEMADIGLIVDGSATMNYKFGKEELFDSSVQIAANIASKFIYGGNRLSMLVLGDRVLRVFPGTGKQHLARVLNQLAECKPGENVSLSTIQYLPVKLFPSHATIILISILSEKDIPAITRLLASGYQVNLISPDPVKFASRFSYPPLALRAATLERAALLWKIREMGVTVLDWPLGSNDKFFLEHENRTSDFPPTMQPKNLGAELLSKYRYLSAVPLLLVCATVIGVLLGLPQEVMVFGATLALIYWEIMGASWSRNDRFELIPRSKHTWKQIKPLVFSIGFGLLFSMGGLQIHISLPFGIVFLAVLLLLFSLNRFYQLSTK